jgi:hypothetical protein
MSTVPAPTLTLPREEWPDADFDIPEGQPLHTEFDKGDEDEDWDMEMDIEKADRSSVKVVTARLASTSQPSGSGPSQMVTIRPPLAIVDDDEGEDDEGVSTIKVTTLPSPASKAMSKPIEEDFEDGFALPSDLTQLSLAPLTLNHRNSKNCLEWGEKDQTSSSQSSDAYSTFGFADASPSSNSTSSLSLPGSETEDEEDLDGLVIPSGLFESGEGGKKLTKLLELKKRAQVFDEVKISSPDPDDDFEMGLIIDDDVVLSPSRLLVNAQSQQPRPLVQRSESLPSRAPSSLRPPSRLRDRAKSPTIPPPSSRQFQKIHSPPLSSLQHQTFQVLPSVPSSTSTSFLSPKPNGVRGQKSHSALKPPTPPSTLRKLTRKASLSSLIEASQSQASGSVSVSAETPNKLSRYETPTAASRAKCHTNSTGRITGIEYTGPPTRPSTPSSAAAFRLTMPTSSSRLKARPPLSSVFSAPAPSQIPRNQSPLPPRPPSSLSMKARALRVPSNPQPPKVLKRPKRQRTYGDGTELDGIDDLPTDRDKERRFRVQPKGYGNRVPGASYPDKSLDRVAVRKKGRREEPSSESLLVLSFGNI